MKYLISQYGPGISVGLLESEGATEDMNLAHNLFDRNSNPSLFHGAISFESIRQFKKFLIYKEYFRLNNERVTKNKFGHKTPLQFYPMLRRAAKRARLVWESSVQFDNFMRSIQANNSFNNVGEYQDENEEY